MVGTKKNWDRRQKISTLVLVAMILFGGGFIGLATWLGKQDRVSWAVEPDPPLTAEEARTAIPLGVRRGVKRRGEEPFDRGVEDLVAGRNAEAVAAFDTLARREIEDPEVHLLLGIALARTGNRDRALEALARALAEDPRSADARVHLGRLLLAAGRVAEALEHAEEAVRIAPGWAEAQFLLGEACSAARDSGRAKQAFRTVLQLRPGDARAKAEVRRLDGS